MKLGVTGHQDLGSPAAELWAKQAIGELLASIKPSLGFSSLALGSDQIFSAAILEAKIPLVAILPCRNYERTFPSDKVEGYRAFLKAASATRTLPFRNPCEEAFYQAGRNLVNRVDTLIAIWNGAKAKGLGGTADAVKFAQLQGKKIIRLDPASRKISQVATREQTMTSKRIFISFAIEDVEYRNLLNGQTRLENCPFEFTDLSVKEPWDQEWKSQCRSRIRGCDGVIALLSRNTAQAAGAKWEMQCAREEGVPLLGMHIHEEDRGAVPEEMAGARVVGWDWGEIGRFIGAC